ncbi:hypothetical protein KDA_47460 [Dictyobacter alpinus]|uniref:Uncharacterized protein n=1 Tax=Dictyobacter alpinus TaxID=2014873 RepID=A0A402BDA3_9CHLR|nr:hypothetical protein [Dictyobacter alpinus]GCE29262.1 hypothetical protein KDA_47460 [Dictyobacter alpinus]
MNKITATLQNVEHITLLLHQVNLASHFHLQDIRAIQRSVERMKEHLLVTRAYLTSQGPDIFYDDFVAYLKMKPAWSALLDEAKQKLYPSPSLIRTYE